MGEAVIKILFLEDTPADAELIERTLTSSGMRYSGTRAATKEEYLRKLHEFNPDVVLSDHSLPQFDSLGALAILKEQKRDIPFIIVTGTVSEEFAVQCLKEGADDYILKGNPLRLPSAIMHALERKASEREREKAFELLRQKNDELNTLIYRSSHDLRAPVTSLLGLVNVAKKEISDPVAEKYMNIIETTSLRLESILRDLMHNTRVTQGKTAIASFTLESLLETVVNNLAYLDDVRYVALEKEIPAGFKLVTDKYLMESVLQNLVHNAVKYRNKNIQNAFVRISAAASGSWVVIKVADNGKGMSPEVVSRIFEMFFKGDLDSRGTGLGLYIVKNSVEKLGGKVEVESKEGKGSTFTIILPATPGN
jgi:hypothetical protein